MTTAHLVVANDFWPQGLEWHLRLGQSAKFVTLATRFSAAINCVDDKQMPTRADDFQPFSITKVHPVNLDENNPANDTSSIRPNMAYWTCSWKHWP